MDLQGSISPERKLEEVEVGRVVGEGVQLIKGVVCDMARDGANTLGQCTMHKASS